MAETYKKIYPGNWVAHANAYPLPNAEFKKNGRPTGSPLDRQQQGVLIWPGVIAVHKVGYVHIDEALGNAAAGVVSYDITIPSPDLRPDDKPRADVNGLLIPSGVQLFRVGLRVNAIGEQPGFYSQGPKETSMMHSGLLGNAGANLWVDTDAAAAAAPASPGAVSATAASAGPITVGADGEFPVDDFALGAYPAVATTADLTLKLFTDQGRLGSALLGGIYITVEAIYMVEDKVAGLDAVHLPGARYSGYTG